MRAWARWALGRSAHARCPRSRMPCWTGGAVGQAGGGGSRAGRKEKAAQPVSRSLRKQRVWSSAIAPK